MAESGPHVKASDPDPLTTAQRWRSEGRGVAVATVIATWGSSPRPVGSQLVLDEDGNFVGSVSGGCIEGAVITQGIETIGDRTPPGPRLRCQQRAGVGGRADVRRQGAGLRRAGRELSPSRDEAVVARCRARSAGAKAPAGSRHRSGRRSTVGGHRGRAGARSRRGAFAKRRAMRSAATAARWWRSTARGTSCTS